MANSIGILNEGFKKYESIKPSFEDELYEAMKSLTERQQEWSDEDKHDNEILWGIRDKWQKRTNAKLTPEEKEIIKKYNIGEPYKNTHDELRVFSTDEKGLNDGNELFTKTIRPKYGRPYEGTSKKINVADRARKTVARAKSKDNWNDDIRKYQINYDDMENALRIRKTANKELADLDAGTHYVDDKLKKAQKELDRAIQHKDWEYDYNRNAIDKSNKTINKLLKRESLSKKRMNESKYLTGEYAHVVEDIAYRAKSYKDENPDWDMSDCISAAIDDGLIYTDDQWTVLKELGDKDPIELLSDYAWEEFYNDIYAELGDYPDEDLEESLKRNRKINEAEEGCTYQDVVKAFAQYYEYDWKPERGYDYDDEWNYDIFLEIAEDELYGLDMEDIDASPFIDKWALHCITSYINDDETIDVLYADVEKYLKKRGWIK